MTVFFNSGGDNAPRQAMPFGLYDITYQLIKPQDKDKTKRKIYKIKYSEDLVERENQPLSDSLGNHTNKIEGN